MPNRTNPYNYHFNNPDARRRPAYPNTPPPGSPPNEFRDEFERPTYDPDSMLSAASLGDSGGQYYTWAPPPPPKQPQARRSRPLWSNPLDFTPLPRHQARLQALDWRRRESYGRETVVEETEVDENEDEADLRLRRVKPQHCTGSGDAGGGNRRGDEDDDEEASIAAWRNEVGRFGPVRSRAENGSVGGDQQQKDPRMRKLSVRLSEAADAIVDIGKGLKKRADSVWRKDSGLELQEPLQQRSSDEIRNTSADGAPSSAQLRQGSRQFDALTPPRLRESTIAPFEASVVEQLERIQQHRQQQNPSMLDLLSETPQHAPACTRHVTFEQFHDSKERGRMAMMERQLRIAEREGAFDDAKRKKMFKQTYSHRCNQRQQSQASDKLRANVAKEQKKIDEKFWRSQRESSQAAWNRFRLWSAARARIAGESGERSSGHEDESGYASDDESSTRERERRDAQQRTDARRREDAETAARYAGTALRSAPFIF